MIVKLHEIRSLVPCKIVSRWSLSLHEIGPEELSQSGGGTDSESAAIQESSKGLPLESLFIGLQSDWLWSVFFHSGHNFTRQPWAMIQFVEVSGAIKGHLIVTTHSLVKTWTMLACPVIIRRGVIIVPTCYTLRSKQAHLSPRQAHNGGLADDQEVRNSCSFLVPVLVIKARTLVTGCWLILEISRWRLGFCTTTLATVIHQWSGTSGEHTANIWNAVTGGFY